MFIDRTDAGRRLAGKLDHLSGDDPVVVGLPRGGVPVAYEVARRLNAPLDVIVVRKLGVPSQPELGMGAVGEDGVRTVNDDVVRLAGIDSAEFAQAEKREAAEVADRAIRFRRGRVRVPLAGRVVVIVDDGIATGSTVRAACEVARKEGARRIVVAVPVAPEGWQARLAGAADECVCVATPQPFFSIGPFYDDFTQVDDGEVARLLDGSADTAGNPPAHEAEVYIAVGGVSVGGHLSVPSRATGVVIFAHGSGSSRHSPRNRYVAAILNQAGLATLLFDLLTGDEEDDRSSVFDIPLLASRLAVATEWVRSEEHLGALPIGYFGASTGAAAALWAAADLDAEIVAVVSRGGRPDLAGKRLGAVRAPTLFIVGGDDISVLGLNRHACAELRCEFRLEVVPGATHLFEEPGTLRAAARLARDWFLDHLGSWYLDHG